MAETTEDDIRRPPGGGAWNEHWQRLRGRSGLFGALSSLVRRLVLRPAVRHYVERLFPPRGVLLEAGCGTGQASAGIAPRQRCLVGVDFSLAALVEARRTGAHRHLVLADIGALPFRDGAMAGLWNLGVMEHFPAPEGIRILAELRRVLASGAPILLFWPPEFGLSRLVLAPIERLRSLLTGRPFAFFPDEPGRLASRRDGRGRLTAAGFAGATADFSWRDGFIHVVVWARRTARPS